MKDKNKISLKELDLEYPTKPKQKANRRYLQLKRWKEKQIIGSHGAASQIRHINLDTIDLSKYTKFKYKQHE